MLLPDLALADFKRHVLAEAPREACGLLVDGAYIPCPNSSPDPTKAFKIDPLHWVKASALGEVQAVLHSHPYELTKHQQWQPEWPSTADMESWLRGNVPWGIVATDGEGISPLVWLDEAHPQPLEGREFIHGVNDCYSVIRDWFRQERNVTLPNFARGMEWWFDGRDLYDENFEAAGFRTIPLEEATVGDCVLMKIRSPVTNHAGVIVGPNQLLHHLIGRLSGVDSLMKWERQIVRAVRYVEAPPTR